MSDRGLMIHILVSIGGMNLFSRPKHVNRARAETCCEDKDNKIVKIVICLLRRSGKLTSTLSTVQYMDMGYGYGYGIKCSTFKMFHLG